MSIKLVATASLFALGMASAVFAAPMYDDSYVRPVRIDPPKAVHYSNVHHAAPAYSGDYDNDNDGFKPVPMAAPVKVNYDRMAHMKLPPCQTPEELTGPQTKAGDGGASHTDACRDMGNH